MHQIDINCDMGEGFSIYSTGNSIAMLDYVSSANIACGFHAGDPAVMHETVQAAIQKNVAIGAHPSFPDLQGFGRRNMTLTPQEVFQITLYQIGALAAFVIAGKGRLHHVKPHGALYNMAAVNPQLADAIATAVAVYDPSLIVYGLAGSELIIAAGKAGLRVAAEAFADRAYQANGLLCPRTQTGAVISDSNEVETQVLSIVRDQSVIAVDGSKIQIKAETICIHSDSLHALEHVKGIHKKLKAENVLLKAPAQI